MTNVPFWLYTINKIIYYKPQVYYVNNYHIKQIYIVCKCFKYILSNIQTKLYLRKKILARRADPTLVSY